MAEKPRRLRLLVLHPVPGVRDRVVAALRNVVEVRVTGEAESFEQAQELMPIARPDVVLSQSPATAAEALPHVRHLELPDVLDTSNTVSMAELHRIRLELLRRIQPILTPASRLAVPPRPGVLALGASTGGPNALGEFVKGLPADLGVPVLLVQHMPAHFVGMLADRLTAQGKVPFHLAQEGERLEPGRGYVAPGDLHLALKAHPDGGVLTTLLDTEPENRSRPAVDVLFRSAAQVYGAQVVAVVFTGMGEDGKRGSAAIRAAGGQVLAQDEATSVVWGMPGAVTKAGLAHEVLPLNELAGAVTRRMNRARRSTPSG
jgi:chemotaxis response regulator CheB